MRDGVAVAVRAVRSGTPVFYPTDTLWGLGVRPTDPAAVRRLYAAKRRPEGMPVSVAFSSYEEAEPFVRLTPGIRSLLRRTVPGPYTFLLPASPRARREWVRSVLGESATVGIRIPDHPVARDLLARTGPLTTTSANRHGEPPCRSVREGRRVFGNEVGAYLSGAPAPSGRPSTIVAFSGGRPIHVRRS